MSAGVFGSRPQPRELFSGSRNLDTSPRTYKCGVQAACALFLAVLRLHFAELSPGPRGEPLQQLALGSFLLPGEIIDGVQPRFFAQGLLAFIDNAVDIFGLDFFLTGRWLSGPSRCRL